MIGGEDNNPKYKLLVFFYAFKDLCIYEKKVSYTKDSFEEKLTGGVRHDGGRSGSI